MANMGGMALCVCVRVYLCMCVTEGWGDTDYELCLVGSEPHVREFLAGHGREEQMVCDGHRTWAMPGH